MIIASGTKKSLENKVGVGLKAVGGSVMITAVSDSGIFCDSALRPGMRILSINGESMENTTISTVKAMFASIVGEVIVQAVPVPVRVTHTMALTVEGNGFDVSFRRPKEPTLLQTMNVPPEDWDLIVDNFSNDLLPVVQQSLKIDTILRSEMAVYTSKQMRKGHIGFGQESHHEKKVLMITNQAAIQHSNLSMVASNVLMEANAMLNPYRIKAKLAFMVKELPAFSTKKQGRANLVMIPTALQFSQIGV